ncbi:unnamed protein product [Owenia fusiformis]|uniref:Apple domain-containing protein n=1 Tax=Owenia fusiformis TaxID=6347 RepID=A0A8S4N7D1_OWEFU|nr:unnamed protein product [Owenia fusiformis]
MKPSIVTFACLISLIEMEEVRISIKLSNQQPVKSTYEKVIYTEQLNNPLKSLKVVTNSRCAAVCTATKECRSYNLRKIDDDKYNAVCELNGPSTSPPTPTSDEVIYFEKPDYIYYMPMDWIRDDIVEGESLDGRIYNNAILDVGQVDQGIYLNGLDQWVDLGNHRHECFGDLQLCPNGYTLSIWLYIGPKVANEMYYFSSGGQTGYSFGVALRWLSGDLSSWFSTRDEIWKVSHPGEKGVWQHIVLTWKQVEGLSLWINCTNVETDTVSDTRNVQTTQWNNIVLGRPNNNFGYYGEAIFDELIFWDKKLEDERIEDLCVAYDTDRYSTPRCP